MAAPSLTLEEIRFVAREYRLRRPVEHREFAKGSPIVAKARLRSVDGDWMLKRRPAADAARLAHVHAFQLHLARSGCPVAPLRVNLAGGTATVGPTGAFELFGWIEGTRWSMRPEEAAEVGAVVAGMFRAAEGFRPGDGAPDRSARDPSALAFDPAAIARSAAAAEPGADGAELRRLAESVTARARAAFARAEAAGASRSPRTFIHGDMHAGNVRFTGDRLAAVVDFDECRFDLRARELASAALHFGMAGGPLDGQPAGGAEFMEEHVCALLGAAARGLEGGLLDEEVRSLPWLMIEACSAEALPVILRTGRFGTVPGARMLGYLERKTAWLEAHGSRLCPW